STPPLDSREIVPNDDPEYAGVNARDFYEEVRVVLDIDVLRGKEREQSHDYSQAKKYNDHCDRDERSNVVRSHIPSQMGILLGMGHGEFKNGVLKRCLVSELVGRG